MMRGFALLPRRGVLALQGPEAYDFLDGLITNTANPQSPSYAALLTPQGRFLHDFFVIPAEPERLYLDCEGPRRADLQQRLSRYKLRRAVSFADITSDYCVLAIAPAAAIKPMAGSIFSDPRHTNLGQRALVPVSFLPDLKAVLIAAGYQEQDEATYLQHQLALGVPNSSADIPPERALPLEHNLDLINGISFTKGCYIGQELTARMHHRELVKKRLVRVTADMPLPPSGTIIMSGEQEAGELRTGIGNTAMALLRLECKGLPLSAAGVTLSAQWL